MVTITTKKGQKIYIDDIDADLARHKWHLNDGRARGNQRKNGKVVLVYMARVILERKLGRPLTNDETCDHIDLHKTNNQRYNLRVASYQEQNRNRRTPKGGISQYKGVSRCPCNYTYPNSKPWCAYITVDRKLTYLGSFDDEKEAARAYDKAALQHFGQFARLNNV